MHQKKNIYIKTSVCSATHYQDSFIFIQFLTPEASFKNHHFELFFRFEHVRNCMKKYLYIFEDRPQAPFCREEIGVEEG